MGRKELAEEGYGWMFIDFVPLLYEKKKVARQLKVETWLDLTQLVKELGIEKLGPNKPNGLSTLANAYVV
jgi:hypothetical protein